MKKISRASNKPQNLRLIGRKIVYLQKNQAYVYI